jgi:ribosomal protein S18 acetylase RimI-like enzyme
MKLVEVAPGHIREMMTWFPDRRSCEMWGGPSFRFPYTEATFLEDMRRHELPSFALVGDAGELVGFGQYYSRVSRCHIGRLVVSPAHRSRGAGRMLIAELIELGSTTLGATECSLFVLADNPAKRLYERLGFERTRYPVDDPHVLDFEYMVAPVHAVIERARRS